MVAQKKRVNNKKATKEEAEEQVDLQQEEQLLAGDDNGDAEQMDQADEAAAEAELAEPEGGDQAKEGAEAESKTEEKPEDKVESGKLLVENLPSSYLFDYQEKLKELFSKYGEVITVKRGPIIVTELTITPTLSAIVEFKNKESLDKALSEDGTVLEGIAISVAMDSRAQTAVLVGVPYEASSEYVKLLFSQCGEITHIHEFSKTKYKILRVTFVEPEAVEKALKLDRELRINGFLVTVSKYRDEDEQKAHNASQKHKRQHPQQQNRSNTNANTNTNSNANSNANRSTNNFRPRPPAAFAARGNFRGGRGRGFGGRGGAFPRGAFTPVNSYMPPQGFMGRPGGFMNDGQRPNKRLRQM